MPSLTQFVLIGGLCWLLAFVSVTHDVTMSQQWRSSWWVILALLFGPLAAAFYFVTGILRNRQRARPSLPRASTVRSQPTRLFGGQRYEASPPTIPSGSGLFLLVRMGAMQDAYRSSEIPPAGGLMVRRANNADDRAKAGELLLHDRAVSRNQHCRIWHSGDAIVLEDVSTNGTFVDDQHIIHTTVRVAVGSTIQVGKTELLLCDERQIFPTVLNR